MKAGADVRYKTFTGCGVLEHAVSNEDADPEVVKFRLAKINDATGNAINSRRRPVRIKWRAIYFAAKVAYQTGCATSGLSKFLAMEGGTTALNKAVTRGDVEIVKILLENGADPYVENYLGMNVFGICDEAGPFPSVRRVLEEHGGRG